jgi:hypothetical protein
MDPSDLDQTKDGRQRIGRRASDDSFEIDRPDFEGFGNSQIERSMCSSLDDSLLVSFDPGGLGGTYNNIHRFVNVDYATRAVDNGYGTDSSFREHMHDVKDGGIECSRSEGVELIGLGPLVPGVDVRSDSSVSYSASQILVDISALCVSYYTTLRQE